MQIGGQSPTILVPR